MHRMFNQFKSIRTVKCFKESDHDGFAPWMSQNVVTSACIIKE